MSAIPQISQASSMLWLHWNHRPRGRACHSSAYPLPSFPDRRCWHLSALVLEQLSRERKGAEKTWVRMLQTKGNYKQRKQVKQVCSFHFVFSRSWQVAASLFMGLSLAGGQEPCRGHRPNEERFSMPGALESPEARSKRRAILGFAILLDYNS